METLFDKMDKIIKDVNNENEQKEKREKNKHEIICRAHRIFIEEAEKVVPKLQEVFGSSCVKVDPEPALGMGRKVSEGGVGTFLSVFGKGSFDLSINAYCRLYYDITWYSSSANGRVEFSYDMTDDKLREAFHTIFLPYFETTYTIWFKK